MLIFAFSLAHGAFNATMMILFFYQGWLGLTIRRARRGKTPPPLPSIRRHRKIGPVFMILGVLGFAMGLALVFIGGGGLLIFPAHFGVGLAIATLLVLAYIISRQIKRPVSPFRTPHFVLGILILLLYVVQTFLGLSLLF